MKNKFGISVAGLATILLLSTSATAQADWTLRTPARSPSARSRPAMANFGDKVLLFGGSTVSGQVLDDTWLWDGKNWTQLTEFGLFNTGPHPPARKDAMMAYHPDTGKVVMFGGVGANNQILGDTWVFLLEHNDFLNRDFFSWGQPSLDVSPPARDQGNMAYEPVSNKIVLTAGFSGGANLNDTWVFDPGVSSIFTPVPASWKRVHTNAFSPARSLAAMDQCGDNTASDPDRLLMFGGSAGLTTLGDSWISKGSATSTFAWLGPSDTGGDPVPRFEHRMAYYPVSDRVILYGGSAPGQGFFSDTWNGSCASPNWSQAAPAHNPGPRISMGMATGPAGKTVVLFGGIKLVGPGTPTQEMENNETWTWGRRATCLPRDGSEIPKGSEVSCEFDKIDGIQFDGWSSSGFAPHEKKKLVVSFRAKKRGNASITADWIDADGAHSTTYTYTVTKRNDRDDDDDDD